jgi:hypothetical protein
VFFYDCIEISALLFTKFFFYKKRLFREICFCIPKYLFFRKFSVNETVSRDLLLYVCSIYFCIFTSIFTSWLVKYFFIYALTRMLRFEYLEIRFILLCHLHLLGILRSKRWKKVEYTYFCSKLSNNSSENNDELRTSMGLTICRQAKR